MIQTPNLKNAEAKKGAAHACWHRLKERGQGHVTRRSPWLRKRRRKAGDENATTGERQTASDNLERIVGRLHVAALNRGMQNENIPTDDLPSKSTAESANFFVPIVNLPKAASFGKYLIEKIKNWPAEGLGGPSWPAQNRLLRPDSLDT